MGLGLALGVEATAPAVGVGVGVGAFAQAHQAHLVAFEQGAAAHRHADVGIGHEVLGKCIAVAADAHAGGPGLGQTGHATGGPRAHQVADQDHSVLADRDERLEVAIDQCVGRGQTHRAAGGGLAVGLHVAAGVRAQDEVLVRHDLGVGADHHVGLERCRIAGAGGGVGVLVDFGVGLADGHQAAIAVAPVGRDLHLGVGVYRDCAARRHQSCRNIGLHVG